MLLFQQEKPLWRSASHYALILMAIVMTSVQAQHNQVFAPCHTSNAVPPIIKVDF